MSRRVNDHADLPPAEITRLIAKFGVELMRGGFLAIPTLVKKYGRHAGLTPTEFFFWETVIQFQYGEELPWPGIDRIADEMRKSRRTVERYIRRLEEKELLIVESGEPNAFGVTTNRYDFSPFYEKILDLEKNKQSTTGDDQNSVSQDLTNSKRSSAKPLPTSGGGDTFVANLTDTDSNFTSQNSTKNGNHNGHITPKMPTDLSAEMTEETSPNEDTNQEDSLKNRDDSNLRSANAQTSKGRVLNGSSNHSQQQPGNETSTHNQTSNNTNKPNTRNENENTEPQRTAAAPPAWSNVPTNGQASSDTPGTNGAAKPDPLPRYAANYLDDLSKQFGDQSPKSSQTRAAKIYAKLKHWGVDEYFFVELMTMARDDTSKANITKTQKNGRANRMPYFLKVLDYGADYNVDIFVKEAQEREARQREVEQSNNEGS